MYSLSGFAYDETSPEALRDQGRLPLLPSPGFSSLLSEHSLSPDSSGMSGIQHKVNRAELTYSLPTHLQSARMIQGVSPISENCPETQDLPISYLYFLSIAGPPLGGRDG